MSGLTRTACRSFDSISWLKSVTTKLLREIVGVDHAREAPSDALLFVAPLPAPGGVVSQGAVS
jgi:hypothetical protein